jgi:hypothetical protein
LQKKKPEERSCTFPLVVMGISIAILIITIVIVIIIIMKGISPQE